MKLKQVANEYYSSHDYKNLRDETKAHYQYCLTNALATSVDGVVIGDVDVTKMSTKQSKLIETPATCAKTDPNSQ